RYALLCDDDHEFDGWFSSSAAFDEQAAENAIACPHCASTQVRKGLMAPNVAGTKKSKSHVPAPTPQQMRAMLSALKTHVEENCDYVGDKFADVARAIHYDEEPARGIYGE